MQNPVYWRNLGKKINFMQLINDYETYYHIKNYNEIYLDYQKWLY